MTSHEFDYKLILFGKEMRFLSKDNGDTSLDISYNMLCGLVGDCHIIHSLFKLAGDNWRGLCDSMPDSTWIVLYYSNILDVVTVAYGTNFEIN